MNWTIANKIPRINKRDKFDAEHKISKRVVVRVIDSNRNFCGYSFGRYFEESGHWVIEGYMGGFTASHWIEISEPTNY
jgi:hypothetical protein